MINEQWKKVWNTPYYEVSNFGRVRVRRSWPASARGRRPPKVGDILKPHLTKGYPGVAVRHSDGSYKIRSIHRMVLESFVGEGGPYKIYACHKDGNPENNHIDNLYWGTPIRNAADKVRHKTQPYGSQVHTAKLTEEDVVKIFQDYHAGGVSQHELATQYGVHQPAIQKIVNRRSWKHITAAL